MGKDVKTIGKSFNRKALLTAFAPGAVLFLLHRLFIFSQLYWHPALWWMDIPMHLIGGACVAWAAVVLIRDAQKRNALPALPINFMVLTILGVVALVGVFWEFYEFVSDVWRGSALQGGIADTMKDMANDMVGGLILALIYKCRFGKRNKMTR